MAIGPRYAVPEPPRLMIPDNLAERTRRRVTAAGHAVPDFGLCNRLSRSRQYLHRQVTDAERAESHRRGDRVWRGRFLYRLLPAGDSGDPDCRALECEALSLAFGSLDHLGNRGDPLRVRRPAPGATWRARTILLAAFSAGGGRGGFLSGRRRLSVSLVPRTGPRSGERACVS